MQAFPAYLALVSMLSGGTVAASSAPSQAQSYAVHIAEASRRFALPALWIETVMRAESAGDPHAVSRAGAIGLMQIMPDTWADLCIRHRLGKDPYDPRDNILAGAAYLRELYDRYGSPGFLAAYNAGPGRYEASLAGRPLPAKTRAYVASIAPKIGANNIVATDVHVSSRSPAWRAAPLFVAQPGRGSVSNLALAKGPPNGAAVAAATRNVLTVALPSGDLFVTRSMQGPAR